MPPNIFKNKNYRSINDTHRHFLSFGRVDLTASTSLQPNRSSHLLLMSCCLPLRQSQLVNNLGDKPVIVILSLLF